LADDNIFLMVRRMFPEGTPYEDGERKGIAEWGATKDGNPFMEGLGIEEPDELIETASTIITEPPPLVQAPKQEPVNEYLARLNLPVQRKLEEPVDGESARPMSIMPNPLGEQPEVQYLQF
jgi:hypothetical protein